MRRLLTDQRHMMMVGAKFALVLGIVYVLQTILGSEFMEDWSGYTFVRATGMSVASFDWLIILIFLFVLATYRRFTDEDTHCPSVRQMGVAILGILLTFTLSFIAVHPEDETFHRMAAFTIRYHVIGGPIMGSYLSSMMTFVAIPTMFLVFPMHFFRTYRWKLLFTFIGLQLCFFVTVPEALYHAYFNPYLLKTVLAMTHLFLKNVSADIAKNILTANSFIVRVGPACSGLSFIILFASFFTYVLMSFARIGRIRKLRAALIFILGVVTLFFLNALRIALIMLVGTVAPHLAMNLFHSAVGAVIFFIFFLFFLPVMRRWVVVRHARHHAS